MIVVIDCGMGNLQSVVRGLKKAGGTVIVSSDTDDVRRADQIVLPGVGSFAHGMQQMSRTNLLEVLAERVLQEKIPVLGICLGHQMLTDFSEEGAEQGLGWIEGKTRLLNSADSPVPVKVPHMGWNTIQASRECPLLEGIPDDACFYFAHSYALSCRNAGSTVATTEYGVTFASVVQKENIFGVQFHPEKSQANGITILRNFIRLNETDRQRSVRT